MPLFSSFVKFVVLNFTFSNVGSNSQSFPVTVIFGKVCCFLTKSDKPEQIKKKVDVLLCLCPGVHCDGHNALLSCSSPYKGNTNLKGQDIKHSQRKPEKLFSLARDWRTLSLCLKLCNVSKNK